MTAGLLALATLRIRPGLEMLALPVLAGLITGGVSAYRRCASVAAAVPTTCVAALSLLYKPAPAHAWESASDLALITSVMVAVAGVGLFVGWVIGVLAGMHTGRSRTARSR